MFSGFAGYSREVVGMEGEDERSESEEGKIKAIVPDCPILLILMNTLMCHLFLIVPCVG